MTSTAKKTVEPVVSTPEKKREMGPVSPTRFSPYKELEQMFERFFPRGWLRPTQWERSPWFELGMPFEGETPRVDVVDRDQDILVRAELPGVEKKDLDVSLSDNTVTIKGKTHQEKESEKGDYYRREISSGYFSRTVMLPGEVDAKHTKATFKDGILELTLGKVERSKRRSIEIH